MIKTRGKQTVYLALAAILAMSVLIAGCGKSPEQNTTQSGTELQGTITIAGSTSVQPFSEVLAQKFMEKNPKVKINVQGGGSAQGITAASSGTAQIGSSSAELKADQKQLGLVETKIGLDGIAVVVNPANPVAGLKADEIKNIFLGNIKNWKEVGGPDAPITVVSREEGSGTRSAFEELLLAKQSTVKTAIVQNSTGAVKTTVAGDKNAIGYDSLASVDSSLKALKIDGVDASAASVKAGNYKASRPFLYLTKGQPEGLTKAFIDFVMSDEGQQILVKQGAISVK